MNCSKHDLARGTSEVHGFARHAAVGEGVFAAPVAAAEAIG